LFSLRQITAAGFIGVFPGCVMLSINFELLPYRRGARIGIAFASLVQLVMLLLYVAVITFTTALLDDTQLQNLSSRLIVFALILIIQLLSAVGCRMMGSYFMYPNSDVTQFNRAQLEERLQKLDNGKISVVHDLITEFKATPAPKPIPYSWIHLAALATVNASAFAAWIYALYKAFNVYWFNGGLINTAWWTTLAFDALWPLALLFLVGYAYLWLAKPH